MRGSRDDLLLVCLLTVYLVWGSTFYALVPALTGFPPLLLSGLRYGIAGVLLFAVLLARGMPVPPLREWGGAAVVGFLLLTTGTGAVAIAEQSVSSSMASIVIATVPLCAALLGLLFGERVGPKQWLGLSVGMVGVALIQLGGELRVDHAHGLLLLLAPLSWALGMVLSRRLPLPTGAMAVAAELLCGSAFSLSGSWLWGERPSTPPLSAVLALVYLALCGSILGFGAFTYVLRRATPMVATSYAYVNPLVAVALGVGLGGEQLGRTTALGALVIVGGVALLTLAPRAQSVRA